MRPSKKARLYQKPFILFIYLECSSNVTYIILSVTIYAWAATQIYYPIKTYIKDRIFEHRVPRHFNLSF